MDVGGLAVVVLEDVGERAVEDAGAAGAECRGVLAEGGAAAAGFQADELDGRVGDEGSEDTGGVAAAADAGEDIIGEAAFGFETLAAGFAADDGLKIAHDHGERMGADDAAEDVVGVSDGAHPVAHGFIGGVFEGFAAASDFDDFGAH